MRLSQDTAVVGRARGCWVMQSTRWGGSEEFLLPFGGVQPQPSELLPSCCVAWWSSEPGFQRAGAFSGPSPGADTCSWAASRARSGIEGEGKHSDDSQRTRLLLSCAANSIRQPLEKKEARRQHCHRIPGVKERKLKPYFHWAQADDWKNVSLFTGT